MKYKKFEIQSIVLSQLKFDCEIYRSKRRSIQLGLLSDSLLRIKCPLYISTNEIIAFIYKKEKWILQRIDFIQKKEYTSREKEYIENEVFHFLGKKYILKIKEVRTIREQKISLSEQNKNRQKLTISVYSKNITKKGLQYQIRKWYTQQAEEIILPRFEICKKEMRYYYKIGNPPASFRWMKARWGSCSHDNKITFNTKLIFLKTELIDYVIYHELSHIIEHNHSRRFYQVLETVLPNRKFLEKKLKLV